MSCRTKLPAIPFPALAALSHAAGADIDLFGGYSFTSMKSEDRPDRVNRNGWKTAISVFPASRFGLTADVAVCKSDMVGHIDTGSRVVGCVGDGEGR